jgi:glycine hydroxymethyltransferase
MVPFDDKSPFVTSGIRIGTPAITSRGMKEAQMKKIVQLIDKVLMNHDNEKVILKVRDEVNLFMEKFPLY